MAIGRVHVPIGYIEGHIVNILESARVNTNTNLGSNFFFYHRSPLEKLDFFFVKYFEIPLSKSKQNDTFFMKF